MYTNEWLQNFKDNNNRALRVLHIGNIANNAYINSKIMRKIGIDSDVLCYDYYHVMGCPEWDECEINEEIDNNYPDFSKVNLNGFKRPDWFIQGPREIAVQYLIEKNEKNTFKAQYYLFLLKINFMKLCKKGNSRTRLLSMLFWFEPYRRSFFKLSWKSRISIACSSILISAFKVINKFFNLIKIIPKLLTKRTAKVIPTSQNLPPDLLHSEFVNFIPKTEDIPSKANPERKGSTELTLKKVLRYMYVKSRSIYAISRNIGPYIYSYINTQSHLILASNLKKLDTLLPQWKRLFEHYDIIIGYSTDAMWPQQVGFMNYAAYEHGTIKMLPFLDNATGRLCKSVYLKAPLVFSTNTDSFKIGKDDLKINLIFPLPHAFESSRAISFYEKNHLEFKKLYKYNVFFAPARHHWKEGVPKLWHKGNNVIIDAIKALSEIRQDFKVIFVDWGAETHLSKEYINELQVSQWIEWIEPVSKFKLWKYYMTSAGVIDQFIAPAIGGVAFEAFALRAPLMTHLNENEVTEFFGEMPPMYNTPNASSLAEAMLSILVEPEVAYKRAKEAQQWLLSYHSEERILEIQLEAFKLIFKKNNGRKWANNFDTALPVMS